MDRSTYRVRKRQLSSEKREDDYRHLTAGERLDIVEQLTKTAWEIRTGMEPEPRLRRDVGRVIRLADVEDLERD